MMEPRDPWHSDQGDHIVIRTSITKVKRYESRYNSISKKVLGFKSPNEIVEQYSI